MWYAGDATGNGVRFWRSFAAGLGAAGMVGAGFGLAFSVRTGTWGDTGWQFWSAFLAAPVLVGYGLAWYFLQRDQARRQSAWDIFVERELERESHKPVEMAPQRFAKVGRLVSASRSRKGKGERGPAAQTGV